MSGESNQQAITRWLMQCPTLSELWNISAEERDSANVIFPSGSSPRRNINDFIDVAGFYQAEIKPLASVYEEYQINCYKSLANNENEFNILKIKEVEDVIRWITEQDEMQNFPQLEGKTVVAAETFPFVPQIRGVEPDTGMICYYITLRVTYINTAKGRSVECQI